MLLFLLLLLGTSTSFIGDALNDFLGASTSHCMMYLLCGVKLQRKQEGEMTAFTIYF